MHHAKTPHIKPYNESVTSVTPRLHRNNTDVFAQRRNSYTERRIMVLCRQFVDKCRQQKAEGRRTKRCPSFLMSLYPLFPCGTRSNISCEIVRQITCIGIPDHAAFFRTVMPSSVWDFFATCYASLYRPFLY